MYVHTEGVCHALTRQGQPAVSCVEGAAQVAVSGTDGARGQQGRRRNCPPPRRPLGCRQADGGLRRLFLMVTGLTESQSGQKKEIRSW